MNKLIPFALLAACFSAAAQFNERAAPKLDTLPDPIPACVKRAEVVPGGVVYYCAASARDWCMGAEDTWTPRPTAAMANDPAALRLLAQIAGHSADPNKFAARCRQLAGG